MCLLVFRGKVVDAVGFHAEGSEKKGDLGVKVGSRSAPFLGVPGQVVEVFVWLMEDAVRGRFDGGLTAEVRRLDVI